MNTVPLTIATPRETIAALQRLTREYASFSRSRSGLGNVLGGVCGLLAFASDWALGASAVAAAITVSLTLAWLVGKEIIRRRLYQGFGRAREAWVGVPRREHRASLAIITPPLLGFAVALVALGWLPRPVAWPYLLFCLATPWIAWRFLATTYELNLGLGLLFMSAVTASGHAAPLLVLLFVPAYAATMIPLGLEEHRRYRGLAARLDIQGGGPG